MSRYIPITIINEMVRGDGVSVGAKGSGEDVILQISFNDMWEDYSMHITWQNAHGELSITYLGENIYSNGAYNVPVPTSAKAYAGEITASVRGVTTSQATVSAEATFIVDEAVYDPEYEEDLVTTTVADQLQIQIDAITDSKGEPNGIATLDENGRVEPEQLPLMSDITYFEEYMDARADELAEYADTLAEQMEARISGHWVAHIEGELASADAEPVERWDYAFTINNGYIYQETDIINFYFNGRRLGQDEYTMSASGTNVLIRLYSSLGLQSVRQFGVFDRADLEIIR